MDLDLAVASMLQKLDKKLRENLRDARNSLFSGDNMASGQFRSELARAVAQFFRESAERRLGPLSCPFPPEQFSAASVRPGGSEH